MRLLPERVKTVFRKAVSDDVAGEAAKVAFFLFLSLFPLVLVLFGLTGLIGGEAAFTWVMTHLRTLLPPGPAGYLEEFVREATTEPRPGILSLSALLLVWAASSGVAALTDGLNAMYDVAEPRGWFRKRGLSILLMVALSVLLTSGATLVVAGPELGELLGIAWVGTALGWVGAYLLLVLLLWLLYFFLPNRDQAQARWRCLIGAAAGSVVWLAVTGLFRLYVSSFGRYSETYGAVGAVIVLLLWLYLTAMAILFGGEVTATLERGTGHGSGIPAGSVDAEPTTAPRGSS